MLGLLELLSDQYQSGEGLAKQLGISRAGVWKRIEALREEGYPVDVLKGKGYRLLPGTPTPKALSPLLKGHFGRPYRYLGAAGSTQDILKQWMQEEIPQGALVLAERQEQGRGRRGRTWSSNPGSSLTFSLLLRPRLSIGVVPLLPLAAGLALCEAVGTGGLKWPNDLLSNTGQKMAGILLEAQMTAEDVAYAILGVGVNVHKPVPKGATSLDAFVRLSRVEALARFLDKFEARYLQLHQDPETVLEAYRAYSYTLGREVSVATPDGEVRGKAVDVGLDGALLVRLAGKAKLKSISAGDVQLVEPI